MKDVLVHLFTGVLAGLLVAGLAPAKWRSRRLVIGAVVALTVYTLPPLVHF